MIDLKLHHGDMIDVLKNEVRDNSVDLIITSPPYNVGVDYGEEVDDSKGIAGYIDFAEDAMIQMARVLKNGGRACVEIGGSTRNFPLSWIWQNAAYSEGLQLFSEIGLEHRKTNQCAWGSWMKADAVYTIPNFHMMYVFYKDTDRKSGISTRITKSDFMEWTRGYWRINWSTGSSEHPAAFPVELPMRCLRLFGHSGDVVLDPFAGVGTTGKACIRLDDVSFVGVEIVPKYFQLMKKSLEFENAQMRLFDESQLDLLDTKDIKSENFSQLAFEYAQNESGFLF